MTIQAKYQIQNGDGKPFMFSTKTKGRIHDSLEALRRGPLPAPSKRRVSDHILKLRQAGIQIETEMHKQKDDSHELFGVYYLKSKVTPIVEVAA